MGLPFAGNRFRGRSAVAAVFLLAIPLIGCTDEETTIVQIVDCGLERLDLLGDWDVSFEPALATLGNCSNPSFDGAGVAVGDIIPTFTDISVFASARNVGFQFQDSASPNLLHGNVEADSCLMLFSFLDVDDSQYLQCIGTFDRPSGVMLGGCDSTAVVDDPSDPDLMIIADCDLAQILAVTLVITP